MKRITVLLLLPFIGFAASHTAKAQVAPQTQAVHLATALDHLTVLEFGEPVTLAAAGSSAFSIEWRENKVLIKPLRQGSSTDLFVWTASKRFTYELDPPGEAKNMNYAVENLIPQPKPLSTADGDGRMAEIADMVLTRALLGAERIDTRAIKARKGNVVVRVESIFQSANGVYVRYAIQNLTAQPYRALKPSVFQLVPVESAISLVDIERTQLDAGAIRRIGDARRNPLTVASSQARREDIPPGETTEGVFVLRQQFSSPAVLEIAFGDAGDHHVSATFVF
jgi:hypothetical protein